MISDITTVVTSLLTAIGSFLTPSSAEGQLATGAGVAAIAVLFAVPVAIAAGRKAFGLVKSIKG